MLIRKATPEDVENFIHHISPTDVGEFEARQPNRDLRKALLEHLDESSVVCVDEEGFVYAYGGNVENCVWFLTSEVLEYCSLSVKKAFIRCIEGHRDSLLEHYDYLWNYVWSENLLHKKFLKALGAVFYPEKGFNSEFTVERFDYFEISKEVS